MPIRQASASFDLDPEMSKMGNWFVRTGQRPERKIKGGEAKIDMREALEVSSREDLICSLTLLDGAYVCCLRICVPR